jgi:hypothetical protein
LEVANNYNGGLDGNKIYLSDFYSLRVGCIVCGIKRCRRTVRSIAKTATDKETERGRYIIAISGCNDCHTPGFLLNGGKTPEKDWLTGV